jgi:predicted MFS family arabinose efflux permease
MAVFVAAVTTAVICGSAIGAVLADRFGFRAVFVIAAGFVLLAAALASRYMHLPRAAPNPSARVHLQFRALANPRFAALILLAAIPAKIALTGFLFYSVPLFLHAIDFSQPAIGRMIMLYGIFMLIGTRLGAHLYDRHGHAPGLIGAGGVLTGAALLAPGLVAGNLVIAIAIGLFGLAQGIASAPMLAVIPRICPEETRSYGITGLVSLLRLTERVGSIIGPLLAAVLIVGLGYAAAIAIIGVVSATTALTFLIVFFTLSNRGAERGEMR